MSNIHQKLDSVLFTDTRIEDEFWAPRLKKHQDTTLKICLEKCEETGRISNFARAAGLKKGKFEGIYYNDSDVYKVIEGIAYSLANDPNEALEKKADEIIELIAAAQEPDGYIDTYFTLNAPDEKWTDMEKHEDYCAGHLIEAAVEYYKTTGKRKLLDVACKVSDHMYDRFIKGNRHWVVGHQEPELALVKLYRITGEKRYFDLAFRFIEDRGHGYGLGAGIWGKEEWGSKYCQDDKPVREMSDIAGHAVRAMYMFTGMADIAAVNGDAGYAAALDRLWDSTVNRNMYITGGIGSSKDNEGFTGDYDLPNDTAYCETCASVGMVYWNHRMNLLYGKSIYADVLERAMYNGALAGVSLDGEKFFYVNPLSSDGTHHRQEWYDCSCCPTQISRFIPSIGGYIYATTEDSVYVNLYVAGTGEMKLESGKVKLTQNTRYPWEGSVRITIETSCENSFGIKLRFPGWCKKASVKINENPVNNAAVEDGYICLFKNWNNGDSISIEFDLPVEMVHSDPRVRANQGRTAIQRGPVVYCFEEEDNSENFDKIVLSPGTVFLTAFEPDLLNGVVTVTAIHEGKAFKAIPYYAWDNRTPGRMEVWVREV